MHSQRTKYAARCAHLTFVIQNWLPFFISVTLPSINIDFGIALIKYGISMNHNGPRVHPQALPRSTVHISSARVGALAALGTSGLTIMSMSRVVRRGVYWSGRVMSRYMSTVMASRFRMLAVHSMPSRKTVRRHTSRPNPHSCIRHTIYCREHVLYVYATHYSNEPARIMRTRFELLENTCHS